MQTYTSIGNTLPVLLYWWEPDHGRFTHPPKKIKFDATDKKEQALGIWKTEMPYDKINKQIWPKLKEYDKETFEFLREFELTKDHYDALLWLHDAVKERNQLARTQLTARYRRPTAFQWRRV